MIIQLVRFESELAEDEVLAVARERADRFRAMPGLLQKYYVRLGQPNRYGGVYIWESRDAMNAYRESDLAASIPEAYKVVGKPNVEILETLFRLREQASPS